MAVTELLFASAIDYLFAGTQPAKLVR